MARILVLEDEDNLRFSVVQSLKKAGHDPVEASTLDKGLEILSVNSLDAVVTDVNLGSQNGIQLVRKARDDGFDGAIVVMTGFGTVEGAVDAMKNGADDYLLKPISLKEMHLIVERALDDRKTRRMLRVYERLSRANSTPNEMVGDSPAWRNCVELSRRLSMLPLPADPVPGAARGARGSTIPVVLILAETGCGKGVLARYIHDCAGDGGPFVHINCNALPASLIESELFGHEKGAFTDAKAAREGLFEIAAGGTLFLDEIGDLPIELQGKLLTVIEEGTFRRVGSDKLRHVRARIITATNQDLDRRVEDGKFRRDLLFRLNTFTIRVPPLRERRQDAILIARAMLSRFAGEFGRDEMTLSDDACDAIQSHDWPGNVREVVNLMQRAAMLATGSTVTRDDMGLTPATLPVSVDDERGLVFDFRHGVHEAEEVVKELIVQALRHTRGNVSRCARLIGMQRSSLRYRIEKFGLGDHVRGLGEVAEESK